MKQMTNLTKEEFVHILCRQSTGFSRGSSKYRGVTLHKCGLWEAQMEHFLGKKFLLLCLSTWKFEYGFFSFHCHQGLQGFLLHCGILSFFYILYVLMESFKT